MFPAAEKDLERCRQCGICKEIVACPSTYIGQMKERIGCGACHLACPNEAINMKDMQQQKEINIKIDEQNYSVPNKITIKKSLERIGYKVSKFPGEGDIFA